MRSRFMLFAALFLAVSGPPAFCEDSLLDTGEGEIFADQQDDVVTSPSQVSQDVLSELSLNEALLSTFVTTPGARVEQNGFGNRATILQEGASGNIAFSAMDGSGNSVTILQSGASHLAGARIIATTGATVTIDQGGVGHRAAVVANEAHAADISIVQRGAYESVTVEQTGVGQPIQVIQGF